MIMIMLMMIMVNVTIRVEVNLLLFLRNKHHVKKFGGTGGRALCIFMETTG
jgi:hypothetical protein